MQKLLTYYPDLKLPISINAYYLIQMLGLVLLTFKHSNTKWSKNNKQYEGMFWSEIPYVSVDMFFVPQQQKESHLLSYTKHFDFVQSTKSRSLPLHKNIVLWQSSNLRSISWAQIQEMNIFVGNSSWSLQSPMFWQGHSHSVYKHLQNQYL